MISFAEFNALLDRSRTRDVPNFQNVPLENSASFFPRYSGNPANGLAAVLSGIIALGFSLSAAYNLSFFSTLGNDAYSLLTPGDYLAGAIIFLAPLLGCFVFVFFMLSIFSIIGRCVIYLILTIEFLLRHFSLLFRARRAEGIQTSEMKERAVSRITFITNILLLILLGGLSLIFSFPLFKYFLSLQIESLSSLIFLGISLYLIIGSLNMLAWFVPQPGLRNYYVTNLFGWAVFTLVIVTASGTMSGYEKLKKYMSIDGEEGCIFIKETIELHDTCLIRVIERGSLYYERIYIGPPLLPRYYAVLKSHGEPTLIRYSIRDRLPTYWIDAPLVRSLPGISMVKPSVYDLISRREQRRIEKERENEAMS